MNRRFRLALVLSAAAHTALLLSPRPYPRPQAGEPTVRVALLPVVEVSATVREEPADPDAAAEPAIAPSPPVPAAEAPVPMEAPPTLDGREEAPTGPYRAESSVSDASTPSSPGEPAPRGDLGATTEAESAWSRPVLAAAEVMATGGREASGRASGTAPVSQAGDSGEAGPAPVHGTTPRVAGQDPAVLAAIHDRISRWVGYPPLARKRGWQGRATVRFVVDDAGQPRSVELVSSSGIGLLDRATLDGVAAAAPYPRVDGWVTVPVSFRLSS